MSNWRVIRWWEPPLCFVAGMAIGIGIGVSTAAAAHADNIDDIAFLETVAKDNIHSVNGGVALIQNGHRVCALLESGMSEVGVEWRVYYTTELTSIDDAAYFVGASQAAYCPWTER